MIACLLLAAGRSSRMEGRDKLLEEIEGIPLLRLQAERALDAQCGPVLVTLPGTGARRRERERVLKGLTVEIVPVEDAAEGMAASIRAGVTALPEGCDAVMILPTDMPELTTPDLRTMAAAARADDMQTILRGASEGRPGHPVIFPAAFHAELKKLNGDHGAHAVIAAHKDRMRLVALPGRHAVTDLDTPEAWRAWRSRPAPR